VANVPSHGALRPEDPDGFADAAASFLLGSGGAGTDGEEPGTFGLNVAFRGRPIMPDAR
jgi:hypothetical protein